MQTMGLPALQRTFETLSAETRKRPVTVARPAEVISFPMARIIKIVDRNIERQLELRVAFIQANRFLSGVIEKPEIENDDIDKYAAVLANMKWFCRRVSRPFLADLDGYHLKAVADTLRSLELTRPADGRIARRQAKRVDESAERCEEQRTKFVSLTEQVIALMEEKVVAVQGFSDAFAKAIARHSVERFPVINDHLAK